MRKFILYLKVFQIHSSYSIDDCDGAYSYSRFLKVHFRPWLRPCEKCQAARNSCTLILKSEEKSTSVISSNAGEIRNNMW